MIKQAQGSSRLFNPARLADDTVLALSSIERGEEVSAELLDEGIKLCDYLLNLFNELETPESQKEQWAFHSVRDKMALKESGVDVKSTREEVEATKEWLNHLKEGTSSYTPEKITKIQELLMNLTMPIWRGRTSEFRERKLKRGLFIHG
jgi:hypothetical protein